MGRTFESVRMGAKDVSARWTKAGRALKRILMAVNKRIEKTSLGSLERYQLYDKDLADMDNNDTTMTTIILVLLY
jgi:hypothetical protein